MIAYLEDAYQRTAPKANNEILRGRDLSDKVKVIEIHLNDTK